MNSDEEFVGDGSDGIGEGQDRVYGAAEGVGNAMEAAGVEDERAGIEGTEIEGREVEEAAGFGIGGEEDLEAAVEEEAVEGVGADAAAEAVGGFQEKEGEVGGVKMDGCSEAGETAADDENGGLGRSGLRSLG